MGRMSELHAELAAREERMRDYAPQMLTVIKDTADSYSALLEFLTKAMPDGNLPIGLALILVDAQQKRAAILEAIGGPE